MRASLVNRAPAPTLTLPRSRGRELEGRASNGDGNRAIRGLLDFIWAAAIVSLIASAAQAACTGVIAGTPLRLAAAGSEGAVSLTFLGHASFLIESPG